MFPKVLNTDLWCTWIRFEANNQKLWKHRIWRFAGVMWIDVDILIFHIFTGHHFFWKQNANNHNTNWAMKPSEDFLRVPPETIVDMNGAGDAFVGGFLSQAIVQGWVVWVRPIPTSSFETPQGWQAEPYQTRSCFLLVKTQDSVSNRSEVQAPLSDCVQRGLGIWGN